MIPYLLILLLAMSAPLQDTPVTDDRTCIILVVGAAGTAEYGAEFEQWAGRWEEAARRGGARLLRIGHVVPEEDSETGSDRERLEEAVKAEAVIKKEPLWLVLIGHGTFNGQVANFNMRGPDVSAAELAKWLEPCERPLAVINCASASGPFVNRLSGPNRVIMTATKSGYEYNYTRFGAYLAEAMAGQNADLDKDDQVSLLEAFLTASARTAEFYEEASRLATEHALIDDNGDGLGTPSEWFRGIRAVRRARNGATPDGPRANQFLLIRSAGERAMPTDIHRRRDALELAVETLRDQKTELETDTYYTRLEAILLELALLYERFDQDE